MSNKAKNKIAEFFKKYEGLYLKPYEGRDFLGYIDKAMEQIFNFKAIKYIVYLPQYNKEEGEQKKTI